MMTSPAGKILGRIGLAWLIASTVTGCAALPLGATGKTLNPSEKMMWSTYAFGTKHGLATCFVVLPRDSSASGKKVIVVTAGHILSTAPRGPFYLASRIGDDDPRAMVFELRPPQTKEPIFVKHPLYDIGAFEILIPPQLSDVVTFPSFLKETAIGSQGDRPRAGQDVLFTGFPKVLPGTAGGFPILRAGKIASYSGSAKQRAFLINTDVYPGDSGGPVFLARGGGRPRLIGMVIARGGRDPNQVIPLAIAVDATTIRETVELAARQAHRIRQPSSSSEAGANRVSRSRPAATEADTWEVLAAGDASRDLLKELLQLKANPRDR